MAVPRDYDANPERYRLGMQLLRAHTNGDLYGDIAATLQQVGAGLVLDVGCGEGVLSAAVRDGGPPGARVVGLDRSATMLRAHPGPKVQADAAVLPFGDDVFDAVVAVNVLYHLAEPLAAISEAHRVLCPGGLFLAATPSRADSPELHAVWRPAPSTFDAEDAPALVGSIFPDAQVRRWDAPLVTLPDPAAVRAGGRHLGDTDPACTCGFELERLRKLLLRAACSAARAAIVGRGLHDPIPGSQNSSASRPANAFSLSSSTRVHPHCL